MSDFDPDAPVEALLRVRGDRLELGYLAGDALTVRKADTAELGAIVVTTTEDGSAHLGRYDGTGTVAGLVVGMSRRIS